MILTQQFKDKVKLLLDCGTRKQRSTCRHLVKNAANTPKNRKTDKRKDTHTHGKRFVSSDGLTIDDHFTTEESIFLKCNLSNFLVAVLQ